MNENRLSVLTLEKGINQKNTNKADKMTEKSQSRLYVVVYASDQNKDCKNHPQDMITITIQSCNNVQKT